MTKRGFSPKQSRKIQTPCSFAVRLLLQRDMQCEMKDRASDRDGGDSGGDGDGDGDGDRDRECRYIIILNDGVTSLGPLYRL